MKKLMMMMAIMLTGLISFAGTKEVRLTSQFNSHISQDFDCTVSLKGYVSVGAAGFEVTCSATAGTCEQATQQASTCLSAAIKTVRKIML
ncbi:MAG: hypothetical protein ACK5HN_01915 [Bacteroidota bacterium]|jgi:hypothetical protein